MPLEPSSPFLFDQGLVKEFLVGAVSLQQLTCLRYLFLICALSHSPCLPSLFISRPFGFWSVSCLGALIQSTRFQSPKTFEEPCYGSEDEQQTFFLQHLVYFQSLVLLQAFSSLFCISFSCFLCSFRMSPTALTPWKEAIPLSSFRQKSVLQKNIYNAEYNTSV